MRAAVAGVVRTAAPPVIFIDWIAVHYFAFAAPLTRIYEEELPAARFVRPWRTGAVSSTKGHIGAFTRREAGADEASLSPEMQTDFYNKRRWPVHTCFLVSALSIFADSA